VKIFEAAKGAWPFASVRVAVAWNPCRDAFKGSFTPTRNCCESSSGECIQSRALTSKLMHDWASDPRATTIEAEATIVGLVYARHTEVPTLRKVVSDFYEPWLILLSIPNSCMSIDDTLLSRASQDGVKAEAAHDVMDHWAMCSNIAAQVVAAHKEVA